MIAGRKAISDAPYSNGATLIDRRKTCIWFRQEAESTTVNVNGEIAASDIDDLSPHARRLVRDCGVLIIDLNGDDFVGLDALCALLALWSAGAVATERPKAREFRIRSQHLNVVLRRGG